MSKIQTPKKGTTEISKSVKNCGGKRGRGCAFEWTNVDFVKDIQAKKAA